MITVISQTTREREEETHQLFLQVVYKYTKMII